MKRSTRNVVFILPGIALAIIVGAFIIAPKEMTFEATQMFSRLFHREGNPYPKGEPVYPAECNSIDAELRYDSREFLKCSRSAITGAGKLPLLSNNIDDAVNNLGDKCGNGMRTAMLIGHGDKGFVHLGSGDTQGGDDQYIADVKRNTSLFNPFLWINKVEAKLNNKFNTITLFSCDAGAGEDGARLMKELSARTHATVRASTFTVWCQNGSMWLDQNAHWKIVQPNTDVVPEAKPIPYVETVGFGESIQVAKNADGAFVSVPLDAVASIKRRAYGSGFHEEHDWKFIGDMKGLLKSLDFQHPFQTPAVPAAELTGTIDINIKQESADRLGVRSIIHLEILNDELARDRETNTYYYASIRFREGWIGFE